MIDPDVSIGMDMAKEDHYARRSAATESSCSNVRSATTNRRSNNSYPTPASTGGSRGRRTLRSPPEMSRVDLPYESDLRGQRADPATGALAAARVVVLGRECDLADVALASARCEQTDIEHTVTPALSSPSQARRTGGDSPPLVPLAEQASLCHFLTTVPEHGSGLWRGPRHGRESSSPSGRTTSPEAVWEGTQRSSASPMKSLGADAMHQPRRSTLTAPGRWPRRPSVDPLPLGPGRVPRTAENLVDAPVRRLTSRAKAIVVRVSPTAVSAWSGVTNRMVRDDHDLRRGHDSQGDRKHDRPAAGRLRRRSIRPGLRPVGAIAEEVETAAAEPDRAPEGRRPHERLVARIQRARRAPVSRLRSAPSSRASQRRSPTPSSSARTRRNNLHRLAPSADGERCQATTLVDHAVSIVVAQKFPRPRRLARA